MYWSDWVKDTDHSKQSADQQPLTQHNSVTNMNKAILISNRFVNRETGAVLTSWYESGSKPKKTIMKKKYNI